jgi:hypothetical protein
MSPAVPASPVAAAIATSPVAHEDVRAAVAAAIPPRRVPWRKRLFWAAVLRLLASPRGRAWLATRYRP